MRTDNDMTAESAPAKLSIVLGTYNRLDQLKRCVESILAETRIPIRLYITDAGSTDGTIDYLHSIRSDVIEPIFVGVKLGQARAYNQIFQHIATPYVCWLSDDNVVVNRGLDTAVSILEGDVTIGMVGLKTKDLRGPFSHMPYIGGISSIGILNVNQGVLPSVLLKDLKGFSESFSSYGIDPDLTARVLYAGYDVVYTREITLNHYRNWSDDPQTPEYQEHARKLEKYQTLYEAKYGRLRRFSLVWQLRKSLWAVARAIFWRRFRRYLIHAVFFGRKPLQHGFLWISRHADWVISEFPIVRKCAPPWHPLATWPANPDIADEKLYFGLRIRDWHNLWVSRYTNPLESIFHRDKPYHLRQHCPRAFLPKEPILEAAPPVSSSRE